MLSSEEREEAGGLCQALRSHPLSLHNFIKPKLRNSITVSESLTVQKCCTFRCQGDLLIDPLTSVQAPSPRSLRQC